MNQQFVFWKADRELDSAAVYERLMVHGGVVDGLELVDAGAAERTIVAAFPSWTVEVDRTAGAAQTMLADPAGEGAVDVG